LRFFPDIHFGTERYPEKVARRLRAVNINAWIGAAIAASFALVRFLDPVPGRWRIAAVHVLAALAFASIPLLHRLNSLAAPLAFIVIAYAYIFWVTSVLGTAGGTYLYYLIAAALGVLFVGTERILLGAALGVVAVGLIIALHLIVPPDAGFVPPRALFFGNFVTNVVASSIILFVIVFYAVRQLARAEEVAERERQRSERLLSHILPPRIAERLKETSGSEIADAYSEATILFADMAGFTARASDTTPAELVHFLNRVFTRLDGLVEHHGLEKIKTTGDAYMVVSGVPEARPDHAVALADLAIHMRDALAGLVDPKGREVPVRIGIASGPVVAGVVGTSKFFYDVWGDAVNVASRMESTGEAGKIQASPDAYERLKDEFVLEARGPVEVKGKGRMQTWFLVGRRVSAISKPR
jgi:adenylate cyclase